MKKYIAALFSFGLAVIASAQTTEQKTEAIINESNQQAKTLVRTINDLKTGNWQDVLTSFFQVGVTDLAGKNRSLDFKANLFGLKAKADSTLLVDTNYVKHKWEKNFQFDFSLKLDSQYHFNALNVGFTMAIINRRDSTLLNLIGTKADRAFEVGALELSIALNKYRRSVVNPDNTFKSEKDQKDFERVSFLVDSLMAIGPASLVKYKLFPKAFIDSTNFVTIEKNFKEFEAIFKDKLEKMRKAPLLTLSARGTFDRNPGFINEGSAELVYLQGLTKTGRNLELDLRASALLTDTMVNNVKNRIEFAAKGGFNWAIITSAKDPDKPVVELKPHFEYKRIARGVYANEEATQFSANAELRIRITDNLWLPLTLKYDIENSNFLGFLNVSLNMNAFKKPTK